MRQVERAFCRAVMGCCVGLSVVAAGGCAAGDVGPTGFERSWDGGGSGVSVFADGATRRFYGERGVLAFERFEYGRSDERLTVRRASPLLGSDQWPMPPRPLERRIILERWDQD